MEVLAVVDMQKARLIPVVGTKMGNEREQRATSALLAIMSVARPLSDAILTPLGATSAQRAVVEAFVEPPFKLKDGRKVRPDGLVRVSFGSRAPWTALVEVKTNKNQLQAEQINDYIEVARAEGFDHVVTISNEISPSDGIHPTRGINVRKGSRVQVSHFSWTRIATLASHVATRAEEHDPEQAWLVGELIRYLEHESSGALDFDDMGEAWSDVVSAAQKMTLRASADEARDVAERWDQLLTFAALKQSVLTGVEVREVMPRSHVSDAGARAKDFARTLAADGQLSGQLRVPGTVGDMAITADLRTRRLVISVGLRAPQDKRAKGSVSWILGQLKDAPGDVEIEAIPKNHKMGPRTTLEALQNDRDEFVRTLPGDVARFTIWQDRPLSTNRRSGKNPGFVDNVIKSTRDFYEDILQNLAEAPTRAPRVKPATAEAADTELGSVTD